MRNSSTTIIEQPAQPFKQLKLIYFGHFQLIPPKKEICAWKGSNSYTPDQSFSEETKLSEPAKRTEHKRPLLEPALLPPSFLLSFARNPTSFQLEDTSNMIRWGAEISSPICVIILQAVKAVTAQHRHRVSSLSRVQCCSKACEET